METVYADSLSEYLSACARAQGAGGNLFRGQVRDHGKVLPSGFRPGVARTGLPPPNLAVRLYVDCFRIGAWDQIHEKYRQRIEEEYFPVSDFSPAWPSQPSMDWQTFGEWLSGDLDPVGGPPPPNYVREDFLALLTDSLETIPGRHDDALLQHYGVPTPALDVSYDPVVALWFASHAFLQGSNGVASYIRDSDGTGVVYVFSSANADVVDLRKVHSHAYDELNERIPYFGLRGVQQKGALWYGATETDSDLQPQVICRILLSRNVWDVDALGADACDSGTLFPSPEKDLFYRALLEQVSDSESRYHPLKPFIPVYG